MRTGLAILLAAGLAAWFAFAAEAADAAGKDQVISVDSDDAEMNAAIAKARASLGEFWRQLAKPDPGVSDLALKVRITDGRSVEHFWLVDIVRGTSRHSGTINNDPNWVKTVTLGQRYTFEEADISDWTFLRHGKIVGNETLRVLLRQMPPDEAAFYRSKFETP